MPRVVDNMLWNLLQDGSAASLPYPIAFPIQSKILQEARVPAPENARPLA